MNTTLLTEKREDQLCGVLYCLDHQMLSGNLHPFCYALA